MMVSARASGVLLCSDGCILICCPLFIRREQAIYEYPQSRPVSTLELPGIKARQGKANEKHAISLFHGDTLVFLLFGRDNKK